MFMRMRAVSMSFAALIVSSAVGFAQPAAPPSGHWEGAIQVPTQELQIQVDLQKTSGTWDGTITIPAQNVKGFPLSTISIEADAVSFEMKGVPGSPSFKGKVSADGKTLSGDFTQGAATVTFALTRTGDAKIEPPPKSTPITKDVEGSWDATLDADGKMLRLALKLSTGPDRNGTGTLVSVDQGGVEVPLAAVIQTGTHLKLVLPSIVAMYEGDVKGGQLVGTWTQGPRTFPLVFSRPK